MFKALALELYPSLWSLTGPRKSPKSSLLSAKLACLVTLGLLLEDSTTVCTLLDVATGPTKSEKSSSDVLGGEGADDGATVPLRDVKASREGTEKGELRGLGMCFFAAGGTAVAKGTEDGCEGTCM